MICAGLQQMLSEEWDQRKTFVVGIALFFGLSTAFLPSLYARSPKIMQTFFADPLPTATVIAVILNQVFCLDAACSKVKKQSGNERRRADRLGERPPSMRHALGEDVHHHDPCHYEPDSDEG